MKEDVPQNRQRIFRLLVLYRWLSLLPPLGMLLLVATATAATAATATAASSDWLAFATAVLVTLVITLVPAQLNHVLLQRPWLLAADLLLVSGLVALTGGWQSPYVLFCLSPLMAAAFFFELRGALAASLAFAPLYLTAVFVAAVRTGQPAEWTMVLIGVIGIVLISGAFGYAAVLLRRLDIAGRELADAHDALTESHRDLEVLHGLTASLHGAADMEEVQEMVLEAVTTRLGSRRAVIGIVDQKEQVITGWLGRVRDGDLPEARLLSHPARLPLSAAGGLVADAVRDGQVCRATDGPCTADHWMNTHFGMSGCLIIPLRWGVKSLGVLLVDVSDQESDALRVRSLEAIAQQTAVALGMMLTRQRRASEAAVEQERARIALDMHDSISQSLFGVAYTLDGSLRMLPDQTDRALPLLLQVRDAIEAVRKEIRHTIHDIWPEEMTAAAFEADLGRFVFDVLQGQSLQVAFDIRGDFAGLAPRARRSLYRISQESLTNIVHHAAATEARVCVDVAGGRATLSIRDNGRGFEPEVALAREFTGDHFGLRGMQERARSLGGTCDIFSRPDAGTSIVVDIPAGPQVRNDR